LEKKYFEYESGQYAFLYIPQLSIIQSHPFTISSYPHSPTITFHIKDMGKNTWTNALKNAIQKGKELTIRFHGPYGHVNLNHEVFVLVAGGIGVTPMMSILCDLFYHRKNHVNKVYFNWSIRNLTEASIFYALLQEIRTDPKFEIIINVTQADTESETLLKSSNDLTKKTINDDEFPYLPGRPNYEKLFSMVHNNHIEDKNVGVFSCGPDQMMDSVHYSAHKFKNFELHRETFYF